MRIPYCVANNAVLPGWLGDNCASKKCQWLQYKTEEQVAEHWDGLGGA